MYSLAVSGAGAVSRLRARLTLACGDVLNFAYYRVWYLRIAPRRKDLSETAMAKLDSPALLDPRADSRYDLALPA